MRSLVLKDILILKKQFPIALAYLTVMSFMLTNSFGSVLVPVLTVAVTYLLIAQSLVVDDKSKSELVLLSIPLLRREIVRAKYLTLFVYAGLAFLCLLVVEQLIVPLGHADIPPLTWVTFAVTLLAVSLLGAIVFPFYFKLGYIKSKYISMIIFFTFFFGPSLLVALFKNPGQSSFGQTLKGIFQWISSLSDSSLVASELLLAALSAGVSYFLSLRFYEKREF